MTVAAVPLSHPSRFRPAEGNELRAARVAAGYGLRDFAGALAVSVACVSRWETDVRRPHSSDLVRVAMLLDRPVPEVRAWFAAPPLATESVRNPRGLRPLRVHAGLSRAALAERVGVSSATVAHWECGRRALPATRWAPVADALGVPVRELPVLVRSAPVPATPSPLAALRRRRGLTQRAVAQRLDVSYGLVSRWERGLQQPSWPHVRRLALLLRVPLPTVARAAGRRPPARLDQARWSRTDLGAILQELRSWRGESRATVAARLAVHAQTLRRWELGVTLPSSGQLGELERALGLASRTLPR